MVTAFVGCIVGGNLAAADSLHGGRHHVFMAHSPLATGLDTGACFGNVLTGLLLPAEELVHVKSGVNCLHQRS